MCRCLRASQAAGQQPAAQQPASPPPAAPTGQEKPPVFRSAVDIVSLNVTVVDNQNHYITDVGEKEFSVFEDGARQELTFFNRSSLPIAMSLLIDTSASMEQRLGIAQEAAIGFARRLRPQDLAQVVDFDSRVEIVQGFTNSFPDLEKAIRATTAGGSTSLHNAIYISLKELAKIKAKSQDDIRRRAIVLLSDGEDTSSLVSYEEVLDLAKRSETAIYTIGLQPKDTPQSKGLPRGGIRAAPVRAGNRRPGVLPVTRRGTEGRLRPDRRRAVESVLDGLRVEERTQGRRLAPHRRSSRSSEHHRAHQARILRASRTLTEETRYARGTRAVRSSCVRGRAAARSSAGLEAAERRPSHEAA